MAMGEHRHVYPRLTLQRVKCELPSRPLTNEGLEPPVKASYVGFANDDNETFYQMFVEAMEEIEVYDIMQIHQKPTAKEVYRLFEITLRCIESTFGEIRCDSGSWRRYEEGMGTSGDHNDCREYQVAVLLRCSCDRSRSW